MDHVWTIPELLSEQSTHLDKIRSIRKYSSCFRDPLRSVFVLD